jgi:hypothetical protein
VPNSYAHHGARKRHFVATLNAAQIQGTRTGIEMVFADGKHRRNMVAAACQSSGWLSAGSWEVRESPR